MVKSIIPKLAWRHVKENVVQKLSIPFMEGGSKILKSNKTHFSVMIASHLLCITILICILKKSYLLPDYSDQIIGVSKLVKVQYMGLHYNYYYQ